MRRSSAFRTLVSLLVLVLAAGLVVTTASPASAVSGRSDPHDAPLVQDTRLVRLFPAYRRTVTVQMYSRTYNVGPRFNGLDVAYDTFGGGAADYRLVWGFRGDGDAYQTFRLLRVNGADTIGAVSCPGASAKGRRRIRAVEVYVPRACMRITKRVGVTTTTWDYQRYRRGVPVRGLADRAPNRGFLR